MTLSMLKSIKTNHYWSLGYSQIKYLNNIEIIYLVENKIR